MMGRRRRDQGKLFYEFRLEDPAGLAKIGSSSPASPRSFQSAALT
jgi:hypothetical protein